VFLLAVKHHGGMHDVVSRSRRDPEATSILPFIAVPSYYSSLRYWIRHGIPLRAHARTSARIVSDHLHVRAIGDRRFSSKCLHPTDRPTCPDRGRSIRRRQPRSSSTFAIQMPSLAAASRFPIASANRRNALTNAPEEKREKEERGALATGRRTRQWDV